VAAAAERDADLLALVAGKPAVVPADVTRGFAGLPFSPADHRTGYFNHSGARRAYRNVTP